MPKPSAPAPRAFTLGPIGTFACVEKHCGRRIALAPAPAPAWDVHDSLLDRRKFSQATGWQPQITLDEGIRQAVKDSRT